MTNGSEVTNGGETWNKGELCVEGHEVGRTGHKVKELVGEHSNQS